MKLLKDLGSLFKATRIYLGYVRSDLAVGDFRAAVSSVSPRVELEKVRTEYATVFGPSNIGSRAFSESPIHVENLMLGFAWRLGAHGMEEFAAIDAARGLWNACHKSGGFINEFQRATFPILRSWYRGHMTREDRNNLIEVSPVFSRYLRDNGLHTAKRIDALVIFKWLESHA